MLLPVCLRNVARQGLGKRVPAATTTDSSRRIIGRGVFYAVCDMANLKFLVRLFPELLISLLLK
jgi:hypothetical protein